MRTLRVHFVITALTLFAAACQSAPVYAATNVMMENVRGSANSYYFNTASSYTVLGSTVQVSTATLTVGTTGTGNVALGCIKFPSGFQCAPGASTSTALSSVTAGYGLLQQGTALNVILALNGNTSSYIQNTSSLQSGATFYTSSGTATNLNTTTLGFADGTSQTTAYPGAGNFIQNTLAVQTATFTVVGGRVYGTFKATGTVTLGSTGFTTTISSNAILPGATFYSNANSILTGIQFSPTTSGILGTPTNDNASTGYVGEYISSNTTTGSAYTTSNAYADCVSITLTAGDWDISASQVQQSAGTTTASKMGISTTAGNSSSGLVSGANALDWPAFATSVHDAGMSIPAVRASISATTTYYLKIQATYSVSAPTCLGRISARRVR